MHASLWSRPEAVQRDNTHTRTYHGLGGYSWRHASPNRCGEHYYIVASSIKMYYQNILTFTLSLTNLLSAAYATCTTSIHSQCSCEHTLTSLSPSQIYAQKYARIHPHTQTHTLIFPIIRKFTKRASLHPAAIKSLTFVADESKQDKKKKRKQTVNLQR